MPEMQKRKDASAGSTDWPWILICIDDLKRCIDSINDQTLRRLASILVLGKGLRVAVIVSGNAADITKLSASGERFTMEMTGKRPFCLAEARRRICLPGPIWRTAPRHRMQAPAWAIWFRMAMRSS